MVRVTGGGLRGRVLQTPRDQRVRPTTGRAREALFAMLGERVTGAWALDLFAGSGVLGLETLSRGGGGALFVEQDGSIAELIRLNLRACGMETRGEVVTASVLHPGLVGQVQQGAMRRFGQVPAIGLVFMDPPYGRGLVPAALEMLAHSPLLAPKAVVVAEHEPGGEGKALQGAWHPLQNRAYGDTRISFWQWRG
ncbi:MAG: 16S rRNA (guanine(966)-N(2))-methyltransferase RsmD [Magnetococcales bacterium]|nr:16S rRNA (guanine(966)-N(2))-methyltransferase RsmD [Magnetococcales bacterium]